jgi:hypothetical protein
MKGVYITSGTLGVSQLTKPFWITGTMKKGDSQLFLCVWRWDEGHGLHCFLYSIRLKYFSFQEELRYYHKCT